MTYINEIGKVYGTRTVIAFAGKSKGGAYLWQTRCLCGSEVVVYGTTLRSESPKGCRSCSHVKDIQIGATFGRWTVTQDLGTHDGYRWIRCRCECGYEREHKASDLRRKNGSGGCPSCGQRRHIAVGSKYGSWTVNDSFRRGDDWYCHVTCACGSKSEVYGSMLTTGRSTHCCSCAAAIVGHKNRIRPYEALYNSALKSAKESEHEWALTYEDFVAFANCPVCHYCHASVTFAQHRIHHKPNNSRYNLDRTNNDLGYIKGNVVVCCKRCNQAKGNRFTYQEWYEMTERFRKLAA